MKTYYYTEIDSTNTEAKRLINAGLKEPALLIAKHQTAGRGRQGKSFYSPSETGIYMTVVLQPECSMDSAVTLTTTVACIVAQSINKVYGIDLGIKWVNDLYLKDRKICGILCEAVNDYETMTLKHVIIGIGINMRTEDFPDDISKVAGSLLSDSKHNTEQLDVNKADDSKAFDVSELLENKYPYTKLVEEISGRLYEKIPSDFALFLDFYKANSTVLGKQIYFIENDKQTNAVAKDIDAEGGLVVLLEDGTQRVLRSGEISVRVNK